MENNNFFEKILKELLIHEFVAINILNNNIERQGYYGLVNKCSDSVPFLILTDNSTKDKLYPAIGEFIDTHLGALATSHNYLIISIISGAIMLDVGLLFTDKAIAKRIMKDNSYYYNLVDNHGCTVM